MSLAIRTSKKTVRLAICIAVAATLAACGGGNGFASNAQIDANASVFAADFANRVNRMVLGLSSVAGLKDSSVFALFDSKYLDAGYTKTTLTADMAANSDALAANLDLSLFPSATLSNIVIGSCDAQNICTLNATLTNADADVTEVNFTTKVIYTGSGYVFYGDQTSS